MSQEVELKPMESNQANQSEEVDTDLGENAMVEGADNPAFQDSTLELESHEKPAMTFVDFMPRILEEAYSNTDAPVYTEFSSVLEQANQWLQGNPDFQVMKLESFIKRFSASENSADLDTVVSHESSHGINRYIRGLRLWLAPKEDNSAPVQEIGYVTTLPEVSDGDSNDADANLALFRASLFHINTTMPSYSGVKEMMDNLNKFLKKRPIPGNILNMETLKVKYDDKAAKCVNSEKMCWVDCGRDDRVYLYGLRIYYIVGKPAFEVVGYHDEVPICQNDWEVVSKLRLSPFVTVVQRARNWLRQQKGIRVVNMQTVDAFCDRTMKGEARIHNDKAGYAEAARRDTQLARILRVFFLVDSKNSECPYNNINLSTRLFIPTRQGDWGKNCETFSKTMQRVIKWLSLTKTPIFGVETVNYPFSPESYGTGVREESASMSLVANQGKYFITTVRLYFPCEFEEPPPELLAQPEEEQGWWACTVS